MQINISGVCSEHSVATNGYLYNYTSAENLTQFMQIIDSLKSHIPNIKPECRHISLSHGCNGLFVPCDLITGKPRAICSNTCCHFRGLCSKEYAAFQLVLHVLKINQPDLCTDTLLFIKKVFGANATLKGDELNCIGMYISIYMNAYI